MNNTALTSSHFTIDAAIAEWLAQKERRTGSQKTRHAYEETIQQFRAFLATGNLDLLSNPIDKPASLPSGQTRAPAPPDGPAMKSHPAHSISG